ncbi:MAG TPA: hypothetical protein G4N98_05405 [Thermoflexia bacterium]|nr:hypothetical protein [Thermoflexia bacterium]
MNVRQLFGNLRQEAQTRSYFCRLELIAQSTHLLKARLYVTATLFVQVYRNDQYNTTNLVLLYEGQRLYARDQLDGVWHRHPAGNPQQHDHSVEGQRAVSLAEFLTEVEIILAARDLP